MGPHMDLVLRRVQHPSAALEKTAMRQPAQNKPKKVKNVSHDALGETVGRIHMERQDFTKLELKKNTKAWKADKVARRHGGAAAESAAAAGDDDDDDDAPSAAAASAVKRRRLAGTGDA